MVFVLCLRLSTLGSSAFYLSDPIHTVILKAQSTKTRSTNNESSCDAFVTIKIRFVLDLFIHVLWVCSMDI